MSCNSKEGKRIKKREGYKGTDGGNGEGGRGGNSKQGGTGWDIDEGTELTGWRHGFVGQDRA